KSTRKPGFNAQAFLDSAGLSRKIAVYRRAQVIFTQGDPCSHVLYIQKGNVKLSVLSKGGREAVVAMLGAGEFFGEGCLAGQPVRMGTASATTASRTQGVQEEQKGSLLRKQHAQADRFIADLQARNVRTEYDLDEE